MPGCGLQPFLQERSPPAFPFLWCFQLERSLQRGPGGKEGRDLITLIHSFGLAQAELALPEWPWRLQKTLEALVLWKGEHQWCLNPVCHTRNAGYGLFHACWSSSQCMPGAMAQCISRNLWELFVDVGMARLCLHLVTISCCNLLDSCPDL